MIFRCPGGVGPDASGGDRDHRYWGYDGLSVAPFHAEQRQR